MLYKYIIVLLTTYIPLNKYPPSNNNNNNHNSNHNNSNNNAIIIMSPEVDIYISGLTLPGRVWYSRNLILLVT